MNPSQTELRSERARAHAYAMSLISKPNVSVEDRSAFDRAMNEVNRLGDLIQATEKGVHVSGMTAPWHKPNEHRRAEAFGRYLRRGRNEISAEQRTLLETRDIEEGNIPAQVGTYSSLGYFVPAGFVYDIEQATKYFAPFLAGGICRLMETSSGNPLPYPTSNDTNQVAQLVGESTPVNEQDVTADHVVLGAYKYSSGLIKASLELVQDSAFDLNSYLVDRFAERWGRGLEAAFTNGSGSGQPTGILTAIAASGASPVVATGSAESTGGSQTGVNSIGYSDIVNLEHSVDPTYRRNAKYMFHDQTLSSIKRILDKYGRPLWTPGIAVGEPDTINGYTYVINQSMPQIAASNTTMVFGDFSKFLIRKVKDLSVLRLDELFAVSGQVGYVSFGRVDSNLIDAGTHPLNVLIQHS